ncbi:hypothetical protein [Novosphingobium jiangmenense]|uniref:Uncharacterized protein n=1 Tax=Novosphingobium jiangmenense TaxID=2791981 RepID=A0ABS0HGC3_9SPHN|nr:hypothetical protein [Novosphingobium jiangmenense]MBF9151287.1 hypothetical protein [Novosphingobium jiangmenense]
MAQFGASGITIAEMREFASFTPAEQRYIRRSLDVARGRSDAIARWARSREEGASIREQADIYREIALIRQLLPHAEGIDSVEPLFGPLLRLTAFDLAQDRIAGFSAYRFLYERLIGAVARPWLPGAFCGAAALPVIRPDRRRALLQSISEAAATAHGWSLREPVFYPEFVEAEAA